MLFPLLTSLCLARPAQTVGTYDPGRSLAPLVESVAPAVVTVRLKTRSGEKHSGSGFLVDEHGLVLTANHVIQDHVTLSVVLSDGSEHQAQVLGSDSAMDIALLQLPERLTWPWLSLREDEPRVGDRVVALGNPLGLGATVTAGIVSGTNRNLDLDRYWHSDAFIQTDAAINQGNSGGPLVDLEGRVVAMNTSIIAGANTVGFSIPSRLLVRVIPELRDHGKVLRGYLGLESNKLTAQAAEKYDVPDGGTLVTRVLPGSPAKEAGLRVRDVVVSVDGVPIRSGADLLRTIGTRRPDDLVTLDVLRNGHRETIRVTLGQRPREE